MEKPSTLAERIKLCRENMGVTQTELSKQLDIDRIRLANWEKGVSKPSTETTVKLAKVLGVSTDYLLGVNEDTLNADGLTDKEVFLLSDMARYLREQKDKKE